LFVISTNLSTERGDFNNGFFVAVILARSIEKIGRQQWNLHIRKRGILFVILFLDFRFVEEEYRVGSLCCGSAFMVMESARLLRKRAHQRHDSSHTKLSNFRGGSAEFGSFREYRKIAHGDESNSVSNGVTMGCRDDPRFARELVELVVGYRCGFLVDHRDRPEARGSYL
jgi:hypothetical protein